MTDLKVPCQHGRYDQHRFSRPTVEICECCKHFIDDCPGGTVLPPDSLENAVWQFKEALAALRLCRRFGVFELGQHIDAGLPAMESALAVLDALAAAQKEQP